MKEDRDNSKVAGCAKCFHMWLFFPTCCLHQKELIILGPCLPAKSDKYLDGIYIISNLLIYFNTEYCCTWFQGKVHANQV